ncbi:Protein of unknown function [Gryllus bimaculatus]|nr:Protein of unknown function [Gryllus bimaculatus]
MWLLLVPQPSKDTDPTQSGSQKEPKLLGTSHEATPSCYLKSAKFLAHSSNKDLLPQAARVSTPFLANSSLPYVYI